MFFHGEEYAMLWFFGWKKTQDVFPSTFTERYRLFSINSLQKIFNAKLNDLYKFGNSDSFSYIFIGVTSA